MFNESIILFISKSSNMENKENAFMIILFMAESTPIVN